MHKITPFIFLLLFFGCRRSDSTNSLNCALKIINDTFKIEKNSYSLLRIAVNNREDFPLNFNNFYYVKPVLLNETYQNFTPPATFPFYYICCFYNLDQVNNALLFIPEITTLKIYHYPIPDSIPSDLSEVFKEDFSLNAVEEKVTNIYFDMERLKHIYPSLAANNK